MTKTKGLKNRKFSPEGQAVIIKVKHSKSKKKNGFSLAEVIVAMALTVIISLAAFAVCSVCINVGGKNYVKNFFTIEAKNYVSAYFLGSSGYVDAMNLLTGQNYTYGEDVTLFYSPNFELTQEADAKYSVNLSFGDKFEVECKNADNSTIYQIEV